MTQAPTAVARARYDDHARLGSALGAAFADDPVWGWLVPTDVSRRDERLTAFFDSIARSYLRRGKHVFLAVDPVTGDAGGGALWSAPGPWSLPMSEVVRESRSAFFSFGRNVARALRCQLQIESKHPKDPKHWYLGYLGVAPAHQGQGMGAAMLREVTDQADSAGVPAYLESSNERNLTLYERHGFRVVEDFRLLGRGPTVWRMWRQPLG
jgi:ribosomal protein S18 acetylase RimI-like enzyme